MQMDQAKLDGIKPKRAWFGRVRGRVYPWSLMGWLWTALFFMLFTVLIVHIKTPERVSAPHADRWYLAMALLVIIFLIIAYKKSEKP
ncbi:MAG: hypothetical protein QM647_02215 [Asticcacaulis sp.]|uniref:hypothetical protein n=1 Tax=Asticcacaulis sp. TaxID=1872648 RepID=UPI0039E2EBD8